MRIDEVPRQRHDDLAGERNAAAFERHGEDDAKVAGGEIPVLNEVDERFFKTSQHNHPPHTVWISITPCANARRSGGGYHTSEADASAQGLRDTPNARLARTRSRGRRRRSKRMSGGETRPVALTGQFTAKARAIESQRADALFHDPWADRFAGRAGDAWLARQQSEHPGLPLILRTRFFDDFFAERMDDVSLRQVILLAAGYDTRAY